jgi:O-antigen/teichoic acid export membrane protein
MSSPMSEAGLLGSRGRRLRKQPDAEAGPTEPVAVADGKSGRCARRETSPSVDGGHRGPWLLSTGSRRGEGSERTQDVPAQLIPLTLEFLVQRPPTRQYVQALQRLLDVKNGATSLPDELRRRAVGSVGWAAVSVWTSRMASLVVFAILGRLLNPADFGLLALAAVFISGLSIFVEGGLSRALVQRRLIAPEHVDTAFWLSIGSSTVLAISLSLAAPGLSALLHTPKLAPVLIALSLALPLTALSCVPGALLERDWKFKALAIRNLVGTLTGAAVGVGMAVLGFGVAALVGQYLAAALVSVLVLWGSTPWRPSLRFSRSACGDLWSFAHVSLSVDLSQLLNTQADKLLVGVWLGPTALGYYYVGSRLLILLSDMLIGIIGQVSLTTFSRLQDDRERLRRALYNATFTSACIAFPIIGISAALAGSVVPLLFGGQWTRSALVMQVLAPSFALLAVTYFDKSVFMGVGKPKIALNLSLVQTVSGLALLVLALPFGAVAVAASRTGRQFLLWPFRLGLLQKHIGIDVKAYTTRLTLPAVATLFPVAFIAIVQTSGLRIDNTFYATACLGGGALVLYLGTLAMVGGEPLAVALATVLGPTRAVRVSTYTSLGSRAVTGLRRRFRPL